MQIKKSITFRVIILGIYATTFILLMSIVISISSWTFLQSISYFANNLLQNTSKVVSKELTLKSNFPETLNKLTKLLLENGFVDDEQLIAYTLYAAKNTTQFQLDHSARIATWVDVNGNSISTNLEPNGTYSTTIIKIATSPAVHYEIFRDKADTVIRKGNAPIMDFRKNLPYLTAIKFKRLIWSDVYLSYPDKNLTTTSATPIFNREGKLLGVFMLDLKLEGLSNFFKKLTIGKNGEAFIIDGKNNLVAFPGLEKGMGEKQGQNAIIPLSTLKKPWIKEGIIKYDKTHIRRFTYEFEGARYIASFENTEGTPEEVTDNWKIGVIVPESDFTEALQKKNKIMIGVGVAVVLLGLIIALFFSKLVTTRLNMLVNETNNIKNFHFEGAKIFSFIEEVQLLSNAIYSMKMNLRAFQKYMPARLVKLLIYSGKDIQLGGEKKTISVLFSDIKNFSTISESIEPQQLMAHLSEYLNCLSTIISKFEGTIDKFIGDSVMAFWGAPLADELHCEHACRTALLCKEKINQLNEHWIKQGRIPYITRFGLHTGEVVIGNIGSSERMNYTAIGDNVNMASRLEGLSKVYGTTIIASEQVVSLVKDRFIFRKLDTTTIKGKSGSYTIYELIGEKDDILRFDFCAYQILFDQGFAAYQQQDWKMAIKYFKKALSVYPEDTLANVFISRCTNFIKNPPASDWDGVWRDYF